MNICPEFIKMDKDIGQINATKLVVSLCSWHVLRAIKKEAGNRQVATESNFSRVRFISK